MESTDKRMNNLRPQNTRTPEERKKVASMGGKASARNRRERKTLADALRKVLDEPTEKGSRVTKMDAIAIKSVKALYDKPTMKGLKILAEILGEMEHKITASGEGVTIVVKSQEEKDKLDNIGELSI